MAVAAVVGLMGTIMTAAPEQGAVFSLFGAALLGLPGFELSFTREGRRDAGGPKVLGVDGGRAADVLLAAKKPLGVGEMLVCFVCARHNQYSCFHEFENEGAGEIGM